MFNVSIDNPDDGIKFAGDAAFGVVIDKLEGNSEFCYLEGLGQAGETGLWGFHEIQQEQSLASAME